MKRIIRLTGVLVTVLGSYLVLAHYEVDEPDFPLSSGAPGYDSGLSRVCIWWEAPPYVKDNWRLKKAVRFEVVNGEAFMGDQWIPHDKIREFLDQRVLSKEIDYVVVFAKRGAVWKEVVQVVDECAKSSVHKVYLNQFES
ncbi:MAG: hypothetical protein NTV51_23885 [Verrucomicrobia bacterium]|nr:hypothetical protein [Verrucomicrobiota bacterium]